jgi:DNA-directed RNA polymerase specialized sigma24 family protein
MSSVGSITQWIDQLRAGDRAAAQPLWQRYFRRLVGLAREQLQGAPKRGADEEDVALSAFDSFYRRAEAGHYPDLGDRDDLWRLLVHITTSKSMDLARRERAKKRGDHLLAELPASGPAESSEAEGGIGQLASPEPTPEFAAQVAEECRRLLDALGDAELRSVAVWKMEGHSVEEIAAKLDCAPITVKRKLARIRRLWEGRLAS